jgi:hypothetical protein
MKPRIKIAALFEVCNEITKNAGSAQNTGMAGNAPRPAKSEASTSL